MSIVWPLISLAAFVAGYGMGIFINRWNLSILEDQLEDVSEHLENVQELGFQEIEKNIALDLDPAINDLKKLFEESEFSSNDEMYHPKQRKKT